MSINEVFEKHTLDQVKIWVAWFYLRNKKNAGSRQRHRTKEEEKEIYSGRALKPKPKTVTEAIANDGVKRWGAMLGLSAKQIAAAVERGKQQQRKKQA